MTLKNPRAASQFIGYFKEFPGILFTQSSGGESSNDVTQIRGGGGRTHNIYGPSNVGQLTVSKPYDTVLDQPLEVWNAAWQRGVKRELTYIKTPVTPAGVPSGKPTTYIKCGRVSFTSPNMDKDSSEAAMLEIVLQPTDVL